MNPAVIQRILGLLLMIFSSFMLPPALIDLIYQELPWSVFVSAFLILLASGFLIWFPARNSRAELRIRDGFIIVVLFWVVLGLSGAVPLMLADNPSLSITDAIFESISGLTTTGATILTGIDDLPHAILFYRQQLQWLGGMGIIVLAVAILPLLGIGGMQLYRAETPGPMKDSKLTPRITETAKALWYIYLSLTAACAIAYWLAGMSAFDAIGHAFSTIAIGGFSTHDASIGYFNSATIELIAVFFMLLAAANFALHFVAVRGRSLSSYWRDPEFRAYITILFVVWLICMGYLFSLTDQPTKTIIVESLFETVSIATTTGFSTSDYSLWPSFLPVMLIFASFIGGCAGSTAGGMKVVRVLLLYKQGVREIHRLIHPNAELPVKLGRKPMPERVISAVWGFFALYVAVFTVIMLLMMATGLDQVTAFSAVAATLNNLGPGLGGVASTFAGVSDPAKWLACVAMLMGRLEIFTLLVFLSPAFWRR